MTNIENYAPHTGRFLKEDNTAVNIAEKIESMADQGVAVKVDSDTVTCVIPNGGNVPTAGIDISNGMITNIKNSGWTAAVMTFLVADTLDGAYTTLYDDAGQEVSMPVVAGKTQAISINAIALASAKFIKPRSGNDAAVVAQGADRTITFSLKR